MWTWTRAATAVSKGAMKHQKRRLGLRLVVMCSLAAVGVWASVGCEDGDVGRSNLEECTGDSRIDLTEILPPIAARIPRTSCSPDYPSLLSVSRIEKRASFSGMSFMEAPYWT